ncbi:type II toxin-antitoxin system RelE/ParE family toxin [Paenibacillus phocaensis]|uniref:type II toxin-antitoxin system RelE/ParE family toxin n=1 Tax=Paenibacillus phocaensis TaxID=1776378 RepID=UPI000839B492|nr:type II toxin-antitoxin system RelE/ParE family toxin [Paenibacillus phocaensis]
MNDVLFYTTAKGNSDVWDFISDLDARAVKGDAEADDLMSRVQYAIDRVEDGMPHSRVLRDGIRELRPGPFRITYFKWRGQMVLLTYFRKSTGPTPDHEVIRAVKRMKDWVKRYGK